MPLREAAAAGVCLLALLIPFAPASAWDTWRLDRALLPQRVSLSVEHRLRYEYLDDQFRAGSGDEDVIALRTLVHARVELLEGVAVGAELQDARAVRNGDTRLGTSIVNSAELLRAYLELERSGVLGGRLTTRMGRITLDVGSRRFAARNRYRNTLNGFTGIDAVWDGEDERAGWQLRAFWTLPQQRLPDDARRLKDNDVAFDAEDPKLQFWGVFAASDLERAGRGELFVFGLHERDAPSRPTRNRRLVTPGIRIARAPAPGRFDYQLEAALQFGQSRASTRQADTVDLDHFAHFTHAEFGYRFDAPFAPRVALQFDYASGDEDPFDGSNERFDTLFGARRFDFGPTGIYGPFARANLGTPGARIQLEPHATLSTFLAYRGYWLASDRDAWTTAGVQDPGGDSGRFIGSQLELRARWKPLPGNLSFEAGYAHLFAGEFIEDAPNSAHRGDTDYVYSAVVVGF